MTAQTSRIPSSQPADSHGAVDLAASAAYGSDPAAVSADAVNQEEPGVSIHMPLIVEVSEANFQDVMATSQTVPVVIIMWSGRSLESKATVSTMEELTRDMAGAFQLGTVDIDTAPQIAQAFQIQTVPTVVALVGGRPVPLFQGAAVKDQVRSILNQVLEAAAQMGVRGRIAVNVEDVTPPTPSEHEAPLAAEAEGRLDEAIAGWENVIAHNPKDEAAKAQLSRVRLLARRAEADLHDPQSQADALFEAGEFTQAFDVLLGIIEHTSDAEERDSARVRLLDLLRIAGSAPEVKAARMRLSTLLMV